MHIDIRPSRDEDVAAGVRADRLPLLMRAGVAEPASERDLTGIVELRDEHVGAARARQRLAAELERAGKASRNE